MQLTKFLMNISKLLTKILLLPIILVLSIISLLSELLLNLSAYILGPFVFLILGGILYAIYKQIWFHVGMLSAIEAGTLFLYFAAGTIVFMVKDLRDWMMGIVFN